MPDLKREHKCESIHLKETLRELVKTYLTLNMHEFIFSVFQTSYASMYNELFGLKCLRTT